MSSFSKYLLSACSVLGIIFVAWDTSVNQTKRLAFEEFIFQGEKEIQETNMICKMDSM